MNILFVNSCLRANSRTKRLADAALKKLTAENPSAVIKEIELQKLDLKPLTAERLERRESLLKDGKSDDEFFDLAKELAAADKIVIAAPYYDLQFPALLKIYLENVCVCGITFKYSEEGIPVGLCSADELVYVTTAGGYLGDYNMGFEYLQGLCLMFGIGKQRLIAAEGLDIYGNDAEAILQAAEETI